VISDDSAHCEGVGCDARGACMRYVATLHKEPSPYRNYWIPEDPKNCLLFVEVRKNEMVLQAVSAISFIGGATAK
jgi:hypothetical protein